MKTRLPSRKWWIGARFNLNRFSVQKLNFKSRSTVSQQSVSIAAIQRKAKVIDDTTFSVTPLLRRILNFPAMGKSARKKWKETPNHKRPCRDGMLASEIMDRLPSKAQSKAVIIGAFVSLACIFSFPSWNSMTSWKEWSPRENWLTITTALSSLSRGFNLARDYAQ